MRPAVFRLALAVAILVMSLPVGGRADTPPVHVVLFTHIEDNTPPGPMGSPQSRMAYMRLRTRLVEMGQLARRYQARWSFQPDWTFLLAVQAYDDEAAMRSTGGVNVLRYLRDTLGVTIDPHSHEKGGYNYTDVAHLLTTLGVGGSTVIGGHIWDPSLPVFQRWDRFRAPVRGQRFPEAEWRGTVLMGSGTPNHVNDPVVSGLWRPKDRQHYWEDDPAGNIACVGDYRHDIESIPELVQLYRSGKVAPTCMLTSSFHIMPARLTRPDGLDDIERTVLKPLEAMRKAGQVELTDFSGLVSTWTTKFGARACLYDASKGGLTIDQQKTTPQPPPSPSPVAAPAPSADATSAGAKPGSPRGRITFVVNAHDWGRAEASAATITRVVDIYRRHGVHGDFYLTAPVVEAWSRARPDAISALKSGGMTVSYHYRPPHPGYNGFDERLRGLDDAALRATLRDYETYRLDMATGGLQKDRPGGYTYVKEVMGTAPVAVSALGNPRVKRTLLDIYREMGAKMTMEYHETGTKADRPFEWRQGLLIRPSDFSVTRWPAEGGDGREVFWWTMLRSPQAAAFNPTAYLKRRLAEWNLPRPPIVTVLIHENDFTVEGGPSWNSIYLGPGQGPRQAPFDLRAPDRGRPRSAADQAAIWRAYEELVAWAAANLDVVTSADLVRIAGESREPGRRP